MIRLYGIPNCTTVKKARAWLDDRGVAYEFVDFRKMPPSPSQVDAWIRRFGWEAVLNRRGTTWRMLDPLQQARVKDARSAAEVMLSHPSSIRRPVLEDDGELMIGFDESAYARRLAGREHAPAESAVGAAGSRRPR